jgi:cation:H+ antiporter
MFNSLNLVELLLVFAVTSGVVWVAGMQLSTTSDIIEHRLGMGEALGGLIILAIVTNLPEIAITASAALSNNLDLAVGNILGGIAIQTVVLAVLDVAGLWSTSSLTFRAASLVLVIEGLMLLSILVVVVMGTQVVPAATLHGVEPAAVMILLLWIVSLWLVNRARSGLPWHGNGTPEDGQAKRRGHAKEAVSKAWDERGHTNVRVGIVFGVAALLTLVGGVVLEQAGEGIASHIGMTGVLFGATFLAAATALPEVSTGLAAVKLGDVQMAVSDIFGGNAFLPVLFLLASLLSGHAVLPAAHATDLYLTGLGALLTVVYVCGLLFRPRRQLANMGIDSALVVLLYAAGIAGLAFVATN